MPSAAADVDVHAKPIESFEPGDAAKTLFGGLVYRGGLVLTADARDFGGFSGMWLDAAGRQLLAITDRGNWFTAQLTYEGDRPVGVASASFQPMLGPTGKPLRRTRQGDVESLSLRDGAAVVGIERTHDLMRFEYGGGDPAAALPKVRGKPVDFPKDVREALFAASGNEGFEAVVVLDGRPGGRLLAFGERSLDAAGNLRGWIIEDGRAQGFAVKALSGEFSLVDAVQVDGGGLLLLERDFSFSRGLFIRLRRLALGDIVADATVDGPVLLDASYAQQIDNFEAMALHKAPNGATVLTLLSDDNFNPLQRTLLVQFTLSQGGVVPAP